MAPSAYPRKFDEVITYVQFEAVPKLKSGEIPDLARLRTAGAWDTKRKE